MECVGMWVKIEHCSCMRPWGIAPDITQEARNDLCGERARGHSCLCLCIAGIGFSVLS
uniref:Uncharacterized protein n=1 Tax=Anguilla anguilla TaxID=7936 RepID=A0A0E9VNN4_ANGAN